MEKEKINNKNMGKCHNCGKETENTCHSLIDGSQWYKCQECFDKEGRDGCIVGLISVAIVIIIIVIVAIKCSV